MFLRNCWYVAAWEHELQTVPIARQIIGRPIAIYRTVNGEVRAVDDRCGHRGAPLSQGRVEGEALRCMYHGLVFGGDGRCLSAPGYSDAPNVRVQTYPVLVQDSWIWIWMGDPQTADPSLAPRAFGLNGAWTMRSGEMTYEAPYLLVNDNLCDLSHVDFLHEQSLGLATGYGWSEAQPSIKPISRGLLFERWLVARPASPKNPTLVDTWSVYRYLAPGIFVMENKSYPHGYAAQCEFGPPLDAPMTHRVEQQAVTPIDDRRTRYFFATGFDASNLPQKVVDGIFEMVLKTFTEDRTMIEGQARLAEHDQRPERGVYLLQDQGPIQFRRTMDRLMSEESAKAAR